MNRPRRIAVALLVAGVTLTACATGSAPAPAEVTARPVIEQPDTAGPHRAAARQAMLDAVHGIAPWLVKL